MTDDSPYRAEVIVAVVASHGAKADEDRRAVMESPGDVIRGLLYAMQAMGASHGIVAAPKNRTDLRRRLGQAMQTASEGADIRLGREDEKIGDCLQFSGPRLNVAALVEIARSVEREVAPRVSPVGPDYRWLIEQAGGTVHAPYRVMLEGRTP